MAFLLLPPNSCFFCNLELPPSAVIRSPPTAVRHHTNAGEQVIILSTDTEIDNEYYRNLQSHLSGAASLVFNQQQELTTLKPGYFWEVNDGR